MTFCEQTRPTWRSWILALGSAGLFVGAACLGDDLQNRQFLETLPRDRRASLAENLDRFDRLSGSEQNLIRRLDKTIDETDAVDQARYRALLQNYHLWFQGLSEEQQASLLAISDLDERFLAARKLRLAEIAGPKRGGAGARIARIRTGDYGMIGPYEAAALYQVWVALKPEERTEIEKKSRTRLPEELAGKALQLKLKIETFPADQEKVYDEKLEKDDEFKPIIEPTMRRVDQILRKGEAKKKADNVQRKFEHPFAEFLYFEEHPPARVDPARLERFADSCPEWFHAMTDSLSGDDARFYLTTVYRLIYPSPKELPDPPKPTRNAAEAAPKKVAPRGKSDPNAPAF